MKNILQKWRGLAAAAFLAATMLPAAETPVVKTLGGGPNQTSPARSGFTDGNTSTTAKFNDPYAAVVFTNGDLLIADFGNGKIRRVTKPGSADSFTSTFATGLRSPSGIAVDQSNVVYVVTQGDGKLHRFTSAGVPLGSLGGLRAPTAIALNSTGRVFVAELRGVIYEVFPNGDTMALNFPAFNKPRGLAFTQSGLLAVTESGGHRVQIINLNTATIVATIGGTKGFEDGPADSAKFNQPYGIALAPNGSLVVADRSNNRLRVIDTNNTVSTLYGVSSKDWFKPFPGWVDGNGGPSGVAATRLPVGVVVAPNGTVFNTETYYDLLRQVTKTSLAFSDPSTGISTNDVVIGTNIVSVVGTNIISLGFTSGEGSSDYIATPGQIFYVPVTLTVAPGQPIYSFQMSLSVTGETGLAPNPFESRFETKLLKPSGIPGLFTDLIPNYEFLNSSLNLLGVGWFERKGQTNLYPSTSQDLITFSLSKNTAFNKSDGKVILGVYGFEVSPNATEGDTFLVAVRNASGSSDGVSQPVALRAPTDGGLGAGTLNTIKRVTIGTRLYLVGDSTPFRWFNAGDFGDFKLVNTDLADLFQTVEYGLNQPPTGSDLFNALDSSDGSSGTVSFGDDISINSVTGWNNSLDVDDLWVTFRRSLDPSLKWFARYWSNGVRQVVEVPNTLVGGFGTVAAPAKNRSKSALVGPRPSATLASGDALATPGATLEIPVQLSVTPGYSLRVALVSVTLEPLDGSPALTVPIQFQTSPALQSPEFSNSRGAHHYAAAWLNETIPGVAGDSLFAILTVTVPSNAGARSAYRVNFNHFSASPNGAALFNARTSPGLIVLSDRSASTWNDGIADAWRLRYFGSIYAQDSAVGADADADGDGVSNWNEYQNGTDPTDATSF